MKEVYQSQIEHIESLYTLRTGYITYDSKTIEAQLEIKERKYLLSVNAIIDLNIDSLVFSFTTNDSIRLNISTVIVAHRNSINFNEKFVSRYSEGKVYSFSSHEWSSDSPSFFKSYLNAPKRLLYDICGSPILLNLIINNIPITIRHYEDYIVLENEVKLPYKLFSEIRYNILLALGFVSGVFIQDQAYTFQSQILHDEAALNYKYEKLRIGHTSIYHAVTGNPFGYEGFIGKDAARKLYDNNTLTYLNAVSLSKLAELSYNNTQIQYAFVLFNEANSNQLSLLIKNNCFFAVMEVLKKFFYDISKSELPKEYSQKGNVEKFKMVFQNFIQMTADELSTIEKRNLFMHGDIKDIDGEEMVEIMQKQITFIYRIVLSFIGFDGYMIDHYSIRNNPELAFIKLNFPAK